MRAPSRFLRPAAASLFFLGMALLAGAAGLPGRVPAAWAEETMKFEPVSPDSARAIERRHVHVGPSSSGDVTRPEPPEPPEPPVVS